MLGREAWVSREVWIAVSGPACSERGVWFDEGPHGTCPTTSLASAGVFKTNVPCFVCFFFIDVSVASVHLEQLVTKCHVTTCCVFLPGTTS